jgi:hypothetical protein
MEQETCGRIEFKGKTFVPETTPAPYLHEMNNKAM